MTLSARNGLNPAICSRRQAPHEIDIAPVSGSIKSRRNNEKVNVTPAIRLTGYLGTEYNAEPDDNSLFLNLFQVVSNAFYDDWINYDLNRKIVCDDLEPENPSKMEISEISNAEKKRQ